MNDGIHGAGIQLFTMESCDQYSPPITQLTSTGRVCSKVQQHPKVHLKIPRHSTLRLCRCLANSVSSLGMPRRSGMLDGLVDLGPVVVQYICSLWVNHCEPSYFANLNSDIFLGCLQLAFAARSLPERSAKRNLRIFLEGFPLVRKKE